VGDTVKVTLLASGIHLMPHAEVLAGRVVPASARPG